MRKNISVLLIVLIPNILYSSFPVLEKQETSILSKECDNIILRSGDEISAKILEVTPELVKYKKCNKSDGPIYTVYNSDILMLRYSDGTKDIIDNQNLKSSKKTVNSGNDNVYDKGDLSGFPGLGLASILFGVLVC
tara:strand:+ start:844 stop:1251 length:408 start_codon:yes stop_codon:yes gene_type:complete